MMGDEEMAEELNRVFGSVFTVEDTNNMPVTDGNEAMTVESSPQWPLLGSDVILSCTISRLSDTVSLHWKQRDSSQPNRSKTDQIRINNTVYLIVKHVAVEDGKLYCFELKENGSITLTEEVDFSTFQYLFGKSYTLYRSGTDHSELDLICFDDYSSSDNTAAWKWKSHQHRAQEKVIASASRSQPINGNRTDFGNRLVPTVTHFNGKDFNVRIVPILFEDAGIYTCFLKTYKIVTITLITVKVTAEPSDAVSDGDNVTLTCSVSDVTGSMRLVWISSDGKTVAEKTLNGQNGEEKSLRLIIQKAERGSRNWKCVLFHQNLPQLSVLYYLEPSGSPNEIYFLHQEGNFVLTGPNNPGSDSIVWEWRPHSEQQSTKQLGTFHRQDQWWAVRWSNEYNNNPDIYQSIREDWGTLNLRFRNPTFEFAGLFTWRQTQPSKEILKQWEVFGIKVESSPQEPPLGSDVTLSCTISSLSDTVSLHWKQRDSSQLNRSKTDQIQINNTVYLTVKHVAVEDERMYECKVKEKGSIILTGKADFSMSKILYTRHYTLYRSGTDHSEIDLSCFGYYYPNNAEWRWRSHHHQTQEKVIASASRSQPINVNRIDFGDRLTSTVTNFNGKNFNMRIVPVLFEDAGDYTCHLETSKMVTITLITVKVTAEPSDAVSEGDNVTLTCSVSDVTDSLRLVWISSDGKTVAEKTLNRRNGEEKSLKLIIQKAERGSRSWTCVLFNQNLPLLSVLYYLESSGSPNDIYFLHREGNFVLTGPNNPGSDSIAWEWRPHSEQQSTKQLGTFHRQDQRWAVRWSYEYNNNPDIYQSIREDWGTLNLRFRNPTFELAGLFTWRQSQPSKKILKQWEVFGIKVESSPQEPPLGSDVTLSCTISRLSDTVSLHWKQRDSSQLNRSKTDQIRINNTVYLIVKHGAVEDERMYECKVKEKGSIILTGKADFSMSKFLYRRHYTLYRSGTDHSKIDLSCFGYYYPNNAEWRWRSHHHQTQEKVIASASRSQPINVNRIDFGNRLVSTETHFNGTNFNVRIVPVLFEDAGIYTCFLGKYEMVTITLITVKVTAEPSDAVSEGDNVTLTCSVSDVTDSLRLVWISSDGKTVAEKTLNRRNGEEKSLKLIIQKAGRGSRSWTCVLFNQNLPLLSVLYYLEPSGSPKDIYFLHQEGNFVLTGPNNPGSDSIAWEWRPHSEQQTTKQLGTFHREDQWWAVQWSNEYNNNPDIYQSIREDWGTLNLRFRNPTFELAGLFTWNQTQPSKKILKQWEVFGIKVEMDSQGPPLGSDVTLSCTISRLSDTVSLHWKQRDSSQLSRRKNTDEIHLNNTVYLIVRHVGEENQNLYTWEVQENNSIVLTGNTDVDVDQNLHNIEYTLYRSSTNHSEVNLICQVFSELVKTKWTWSSRYFQNKEKEIASNYKYQPININRADFGDRLGLTETTFNGTNFNMRIVPVLFEDAGVYTCSMGTYKMVTITLITVKVTAEPSDAVSEGDNVTLTCSVSDVTGPMRLVWISSDGKTVAENTLNGQNGEEKSLKLIIQKAERGNRNWTCVLFHQHTPKIFIPHYLKVNNVPTFQHTNIFIFVSVPLLLIIILALGLSLRKCKAAAVENQRQEPLQPGENTEDASHLYSNVHEMQPMQGGNEMPETRRFDEYAVVNKKAKRDDTESEDIQYATLNFQKKAPGSRKGTGSTQCNQQSSDTELAPSKDNGSSVIYEQVAQAQYK
ncbi:uncharacterized protein LOC119965406 [Scyliorhinus canicula]|uniref:uncharacterized protein LOC119965406 n=1 Tax=Scyliorhinus canicula TaxID=7830 RepID=UPI0018F4B0D8|nr:uncharacterized protein LOC119965406 [Scyliorhinus canicula]